MKRVCFFLWLKERRVLHLKRAKRLENRGLSNGEEMTDDPFKNSCFFSAISWVSLTHIPGAMR